MTFDRI